MYTIKSDTKDKSDVQHDHKKNESDKKRLDSIKRKRKEFKEKQLIIKLSLVEIDKPSNRKIIFSDCDENLSTNDETKVTGTKEDKVNNVLFNDSDSDNEISFDIKKQFEGKRGMKTLQLQSSYKSDKRFTLDERFIEDDESDHEKDNNKIDILQSDEKVKQLHILENVLGISVKSSFTDLDNLREKKKAKLKLGMLRFDPSQPEHVKFLATPNDVNKEDHSTKKKKKKSECNSTDKVEDVESKESTNKIEVSKEQFYKVSEKLKDEIGQTKSFSLRSMFTENQEEHHDDITEEIDYVPSTKKNSRVKNPLDPTSDNPFKYDSSESDTEIKVENSKTEKNENKAVWKERFFFAKFDNRFREGLAFFNNRKESDVKKERRELKIMMKKRISNRARKDQMFQKKIGGRKKNFKKAHRNKN